MRTSLVRVAVTLIAVNAGVAIAVLLGGDMGDTGGRILGTSLLATATALVAMLLWPATSDRRMAPPIPSVALGGAAIGFVIVTTGIWTDLDSEIAWKIAGTGYTMAVAAAVAAILAGLPMARQAIWVRSTTIGAIGIAATMIVAAVWFEVGGNGYWRLFAIVTVLIAAGGVAAPILSRSAAEHLDMAVTHCPFCGAGVGSQIAADATCRSCGNRFGVTLHATEISHLSSKVAG